MITKQPSFVTSDNKPHATLEEAQQHELSLLFSPPDFGGAPVVDQVVAVILQHQAKILDILTTKENSKPRARAVNGGSKKRKPKDAPNSGTPA
jgi:hypothetical protein